MHHLDQLGGEGNIQLYVPPLVQQLEVIVTWKTLLGACRSQKNI
jgi:hypothetical protein